MFHEETNKIVDKKKTKKATKNEKKIEKYRKWNEIVLSIRAEIKKHFFPQKKKKRLCPCVTQIYK